MGSNGKNPENNDFTPEPPIFEWEVIGIHYTPPPKKTKQQQQLNISGTLQIPIQFQFQ